MTFILSKILWMFAAPGNLLVLLLLASAFLALAKRESWQNAGRRLCFDIAFVLFFIAIFPVGEWMMRPLENQFPPAHPDHVDGIIVIGSGENPVLSEARDQPTVHQSAADYLAFAALARQYPDAKLVYAGGSSVLLPTNGKLTNADVARQALAEAGIDVSKVTFENKSRNTYENATEAAALAHPDPHQKWLLVTDAFHMPRAMGCFRKAGWNVGAAPANYRTDGKLDTELHFDLAGHLNMVTIAAHEYYGLVSYWLLGYIDSPWPRP
jgi:uncharacterized SAM-binding protein YcdF (DUF218 family)